MYVLNRLVLVGLILLGVALRAKRSARPAPTETVGDRTGANVS